MQGSGLKLVFSIESLLSAAHTAMGRTIQITLQASPSSQYSGR